MTQYIGDTQFPDYSSQPKPTVPAPWMQINAEGDTITAYDFTGLIYPKAMFAGTRYKNIDLTFPDVLDATQLFQGSSVVSARIILPKCVDIRQMLVGTTNLDSLYIEAPLATGAVSMMVGSGIKTINISLPSCSSVPDLASNCQRLTSFVGDFPKAINTSTMLNNCTALESIQLNFQELASAVSLASGNVSLKSFQATWPKISSLQNAFDNTGLEATALNSIFESLPTYTTGTHNIGIKGAVGAATCDISIATQKGWTVVR